MGTQPWQGKDDVKEGDNYPATCVSWDDAIEFCRKLSSREDVTYRLPTEAEWEYACRAGSTCRYFFGENLNADQACWHNSIATEIQPVGTYPANAFGLYDMHGNVHEMCWDSGRTYTSNPVTDPVGSMELDLPAAVRGGAQSSNVSSLRSSKRYLNDARHVGEDRSHTTKGFRVVRIHPLDDDILP